MPSANPTSVPSTVAKRPKSSASPRSASTAKAKAPKAKIVTKTKTTAPKTDGLAHGKQVTAALLAESRAHCGQCGRELRHVPFLLKNIMCRDCYGLDRYRRTAPTSWKPEQQREVLLSDQKSVAAKS